MKKQFKYCHSVSVNETKLEVRALARAGLGKVPRQIVGWRRFDATLSILLRTNPVPESWAALQLLLVPSKPARHALVARLDLSR